MLIHVLREYNTNKIFLSCLGCWPFQTKLIRHCLPILCLAIEISYFPFEAFTLYEHKNDGKMVFECCYQMVVTFAFLVKLLNQLWNRDKFQRLYENMENHWNIFTNDLEIRILKDYSVISQKFTKYYSIMIYSMMLMFILIPTLTPMLLDIVIPLNRSRPPQIAIYAEYGVDTDKYFVPIFCYTTFMVTVGITIMVAADTMHVTCTTHACSLFQIIGQQMKTITSHINQEVDKAGYCEYEKLESSSEQTVYQEYIICLKKHQLALEFVDILNETHRIVGISFALMVGAIFSLVGVRIVYVLDQVEEIIRFVFIIMGALMQLLIACYSGQKLMDKSQDIFHQAYAAEWYRFSPRLKSLLIITLYRSIVPCQLSAGNMFPLSLTIAAAVIRTGMSYFTAFLSLRE